jgi:hypothetical protein
MESTDSHMSDIGPEQSASQASQFPSSFYSPTYKSIGTVLLVERDEFLLTRAREYLKVHGNKLN